LVADPGVQDRPALSANRIFGDDRQLESGLLNMRVDRNKRKKGPDNAPVRSAGSGGGYAGSFGTAAAICVGLAMLVFAVFGQTVHHDFINFDDNAYVYENPYVSAGVTLEGAIWAFSHVHSSNWHPLTWLSHLLDCQIYGLEPGGHHLTNVFLHAATAIVLFLLLLRMTGAQWRSAFVAALFAIHPLRVESVAWVAERKDVLSGLFFMLTLLAYARYVGKSEIRISKSEDEEIPPAAGVGFLTSSVVRPLTSGSYWLVVVFFALGLMSKPMLVTLPVVLLLLDFWPLGRFSLDPQHSNLLTRQSAFRLVGEKLPLFALAGASCVVAVFAQGQAIQLLERLPLAARMGNALLSGVTYIGQMFWPSKLAVHYPLLPENVRLPAIAMAAGILATITVSVLLLRNRNAYLLTGWIWYLVMLGPVIGIFQVGAQAHADRYTYLPQIGLYVMLTWAVADWSVGGGRWRLFVAGAVLTVVLAATLSAARIQTSHWRDSESLWNHTLACTEKNSLAHNNLGNVFLKDGRTPAAIEHFRKALQIRPDYPSACYNLATAFAQAGRMGEAIEHFRKALRLGLASMDDELVQRAHYNLGNALFQIGRSQEAIEHCRRAVQLSPEHPEAHNNLANALATQGRTEEAVAHYQQALRLKPGYTDARCNLGGALASQGRFAEAVEQYETALDSAPEAIAVLNNLAWLLATCPEASLRDGQRAVELARKAERLSTREHPAILGTLAAAYAEAGHFSDAVETARRAIALAMEQGDQTLAEQTRQRLALYEEGAPYHERLPRDF
jgi:protein O-mannosyl-transferase